MLEDRQGITDQHDLGLLSNTRQDRGFDVHDTPHAERIPMMLVQHERIEAQFLGIAVFVEEIVVVVGGLLAVEILV